MRTTVQRSGLKNITHAIETSREETSGDSGREDSEDLAFSQNLVQALEPACHACQSLTVRDSNLVKSERTHEFVLQK